MAYKKNTSINLAILAAVPVAALLASSTAEAATPTYYADLMTFQSQITSSVTDDYSNPGYVFIQDNAVMSGVLGETDYMSTGFMNLNIVSGVGGADPYYCAGCNGSFQLSFQTTSVGTPVGVNGAGAFIQTHNLATPYFAFITFGDGTTDNIALPAAGNFWGVSAPERIVSIHFGLTMGGTTTGGSFGIDDLIVGDGNVGGCMAAVDCVDDGDPCTDTACVMGMCEYPFNTAPCDDGELCTEMDVCSMGVCGGSIIDCDDGNDCTNNFCDLGVGCVVQPNTDPCDDGDPCTEMDACAVGVCGGAAVDCSDGDVCSADSCDPMLGCVNDPIPGCCVGDEDCGADEVCNLDDNLCEPAPSGSTSDGGSGETGTPPDTTGGMDETGADGSSGGGTGVGTGDTGPGANDDGDSSGGANPTTTAGVTDGTDPLDTSGCSCTTDERPSNGLWWMLPGIGLLMRRRRTAA
ncbi:MAG: MYXO-CTERM sorting domain-containing protein [Nannocystaceae bacterium]